MSDKELTIKKLSDDLYLMDEDNATCYLVIGREKACVIDTVNGINDLKKAVTEITDKPLIVINTHGHPDHIYGNIYFGEGYLHPKDLPLAESFFQQPDFIEFCKNKGCQIPTFRPLKEGDEFDLGGKTLEVYELPGHTPGQIVLLLKEDRLLFPGDSINHHLWMMLDGCLSLKEYGEQLDRIMFLEEKADRILHGHSHSFDDISLLRCLRRGIQEICEGKTEGDLPYEWFGGVAKQHPFSLEEGKQYDCNESVICYQPDHVLE
ncbi:MAG: MBL fold metallo-hydrolase [Lachnospiraceae bacterium]|nr:MBL fold metallo-hydrolase [Lachnospiraceae bacterium]